MDQKHYYLEDVKPSNFFQNQLKNPPPCLSSKITPLVITAKLG